MDEGTSQFWTVQESGVIAGQMYVSPPLRHDAEIFMPSTDNAHELFWIPSRPVGRATRP